MSKDTTVNPAPISEELGRTHEMKQRVLEALKEMPIIAFVCKKTGIGRATYYRWQKEDKAFLRGSKAAYDLGIAFINDMSESQVIIRIREGELPAATFWLKHNNSRYHSQYANPWKRPEPPRQKGIAELVAEIEESNRKYIHEE